MELNTSHMTSFSPWLWLFFGDFIFSGTASLHLDAHVPLLGGTIGEKVVEDRVLMKGFGHVWTDFHPICKMICGVQKSS